MASTRWVNALAAELDAWVRAGTITPAQREQIKQRYAGPRTDTRFVSSILTLGAILSGLGVILFVASNWQAMGPVVKVGIILAAVVAFNAAGYYVREGSGGYPKTADALLLLGALTYGAGLWLVAQIFQLPYNHADSVLAWVVGILPVIWVMRTSPVLVLASLLAPAWLIVMTALPNAREVYSYLWLTDVNSSPLYRYLGLAALLLLLVYRQRSRAALVITLVGLVAWLSRSLWIHLRFLPGWELLNYQLTFSAFYAAVGLALYAMGMTHRRPGLERLSAVYQLLGLVLLFAGNYSLTFLHHEERAIRVLEVSSGSAWIFLGFITAGALALWSRRSSAPQASPAEPACLIGMVLLQVIAMHLGPWGPQGVSLGFNLLLIGELLVFLYLGYALREEGIFRLALYGFGFEILARYFDTFWKILPRSLFFLVGGVLLIAGGMYMERQRQALTARMRRRTR